MALRHRKRGRVWAFMQHDSVSPRLPPEMGCLLQALLALVAVVTVVCLLLFALK